MDIIKLFTYWDADQAQTVLEFIDQLRDVIIEYYAGDIVNSSAKLTQVSS